MISYFYSLILIIYYSYHGGRIFQLHVPIFLTFPKQYRFIPVKLLKTFTANFWFYQNFGKVTPKCIAWNSFHRWLILIWHCFCPLSRLFLPMYYNSLGPRNKFFSGNPFPRNSITFHICVGWLLKLLDSGR